MCNRPRHHPQNVSSSWMNSTPTQPSSPLHAPPNSLLHPSHPTPSSLSLESDHFRPRWVELGCEIWSISLHIASPRLSHVVAWGRMSFLLRLNHIPLSDLLLILTKRRIFILGVLCCGVRVAASIQWPDAPGCLNELGAGQAPGLLLPPAWRSPAGHW